MAQKSMTLLKVSNLNCNSGQRKSVEKGIISNGIVLDNALLNEKLKVTENLNSKDPKRPSLPIYRPGMGLLHRPSPKANVSDEERAPDGEENTEKCGWSANLHSLDINLSDNSDASISVIKDMNIPHVSKPTTRRKSVDKGSSNSKKLSKNKRPDQPKYIPKPKIAAQCPSPDPSETEDIKNCSLSRSRSPLEAYSDSEKNRRYLEKSSNQTEKSKRHQPRQSQNKRNDVHDRTAQKNKSTNNVGACAKSDAEEKRSQDVFNGNVLNLSSKNATHLKYSECSSANCNSNGTTISDKSSFNNVPLSTAKSDLKDNHNTGKGRRPRRSRENKSSGSQQVSTGSVNNATEKVLINDKIENEKQKFTNVSNYSDSKQSIEFKRAENAHDNQSKLRVSSIINAQGLNTRRDDSPTSVTSNLPFSSPKGRGRGRSQIANLNSPDNRQLTTEIVSKKVPSSLSLSSIDYDGEGPRPTLIFESSHKITDWNQEVTNEENMRNAAIANASSEDKRHLSTKKLDYGSAPNRFHRQLSESSNTSECASTSSVSLRTDRVPSEFQQNPPPRFQRNKESLNKQFNQSEETSFPSKTEKGILKVNWESGGVGREAPSPSNPLSNMHYSRNSEPLHYKTLFDPSQPLNNRSMHTNAVQSYHQPIVPRNLMTGNVYPKSVSPGMRQNRRLDYNDREQYVLQQVQPSHTAIKPPSTTYPYMIHQPPIYGPMILNGQIPPNPQLPPPQNGMFPQPYSEALHLPDNSNKRVKPIVEKNLCDIGLLERELNTYLSKGLDNVDQKGLGRCRWKIQLRYENIILADPRFCADKNVESALWKSAFHQVIEAYRKLKDLHPSRQEEFNKAINNLVEEGTVFYESLLEKQQETFGINLSQYLDTDAVSRPLPLDSVKIILISTQKLFICLGDLARYREQATNTSNYGKARSWYMKAQQIAPKNGRPYNQLAILAICARRKLDAVYYYMRSLAASNPFLSARESLLGLFDEARKKYVVLEKKKLDEKSADEKSSKLKNKGWRNKNNDRLEVWCHPPGMIHSKSEEPSTNENSDNEISTVELNKRFVLSFLHVHGKLFTKVGMENFTETANQMLQEFRNLLQCTPAPLASVRLLQLLAINMFSVANASSKGGPPMDSSERPLLQEQALQVSLAMMAIVIERSIFLLKEHLASPNYPAQLTSYDLAQLLPTVKIFTDWMSCQRNLWSPPPTLGDLRTGCKGDIWTLYANLLNELGRMKDCGIELKNTKLEGYEPVTLPEDVSLACFVPLLGAPQNPYFGQPPLDKERARTWLRVIRLLFFGDYLCGISPPYLKFDVQMTSYVSLITSHSEENTESSDPNTTYNSSDEDDEIEDLPDDLDEDISKAPLDDTSDISKLWHRQEALKRNKERDDRRKAQIQQVLRDHRTKRPMEIQVTPKYLIPDTNCFIDHLDQLDLLLKSNTCNLVVPLIVINELDGLALGERPNSSCGFRQNTSSPAAGHNSYEHQQMRVRQVSAAAKEAVVYLEESFASREFKLKAITSKGNLLDSISFRSEDIGEKKGTNDDLILSCCLHYCNNDKASEYMPKTPDEPIHITREVVLITDDRNLRVKAMTHNVPTRSLDEFLRWARIR